MKPTQLNARLARMASLLELIQEHYAAIYAEGHNKGVYASEARATLSGHSDPTAEVVADRLRHRRRSQAKTAAEEIMRASQAIEAAYGGLEKALGKQGQSERSPLPIMSNHEMAPLREAQARRNGRGERYGD